MKRIVSYIVLLAAAFAVPLRGTDVGKLQPVGLIQLYKEGESVVIITDSGDSGIGETVQAAFENLEETTAGVIFLDTADFLIMRPELLEAVSELEGYLKPSVRICFAKERIDPKQAAEYLAVNHTGIKLKDHKSLEHAPELIQENGRLRIK